MPVTLWWLMHAQTRLALEVEHEIEALAASDVATLEIDGADAAARDDALTMIPATVEIDLVAPVDRMFRAGAYARAAARAGVEIDRIRLGPGDAERPQPSFDAIHRAGIDRVVPDRRQPRPSTRAG